MSKPLRFKPVNPAHEMVYSADGGWVSWEDYQSLKDTLQCSFNSNRELKVEVDELKSQPDPLTAYLYAAELAKDDIKRLKAEVERLKERNQFLEQVDSYLQSANLYAEEQRSMELEAQVERLTKAGDKMANNIVWVELYRPLVAKWNAAKEGKQP